MRPGNITANHTGNVDVDCSGPRPHSEKIGPWMRCSVGRSAWANSKMPDSAGMTWALTCSDTSWSGLVTIRSMYGDSGERLVLIMPLISSIDCGRSPRRLTSAASCLDLTSASSTRLSTSLSLAFAPDSARIERVVLYTGGLTAASAPATAATTTAQTTTMTSWLRDRRADRRISVAGTASGTCWATVAGGCRIGVIRPSVSFSPAAALRGRSPASARARRADRRVYR